MSLPEFPGYLPDPDDDTSIDDCYMKGVNVHLERMSLRYYWIGIEMPDGTYHHIDITTKGEKPIRARLRK